jgi:hypothetical protein
MYFFDIIKVKKGETIMPVDNQPHIHKKRQNPLELKKEPVKKKSEFSHDFLYGKVPFLDLLKTKSFHFSLLDKDIVQSLKLMSGEEKLSNLIEDAILVYIATHKPSEYESLLKLLRLKVGENV